jgi:putative flippase GtrA/4-amino-4-deoxy-L-arabinose transferase-like glycosyltransferase
MPKLPKPIHSTLAWAWHQRHRFLRFGIVGVSGVAINMTTLVLAPLTVFASVPNPGLRINLALMLGISLGLTNNFLWNRRWTWKDRTRTQETPLWSQYLDYWGANWPGIVIQTTLTNLLALALPLLLANALAICVACVVNFLLNDLWAYRHVRIEGIDPEADRLDRIRQAVPLAVTGGVLALCTHLYGLGSIHIPRNGDELVYMQIARETAASGHWLPLQSGMEDMRNTKPPLLFWQGLLSTDWGEHWSLLALRWPSVLWTFLTALMCGLLGWRLSGRDPLRGVLAALSYLAFLGTLRYGRPYLTNPPETFWVFACLFTMLWWRGRAFDSRFLFPTVVGVLAGLALLTKSFAQLVPIGVGLAWWHLIQRQWRVSEFIRRSVPGLAWTAILSLAIFSLWFALDPDPSAIWREFVMGENVGKMGSRGLAAWLQDLLWGGSSVWTLAIGWFVNAGLLAFPVFGLCVECWKRRRDLSTEERMLWAWVVAIFVVFCIPSQRSERYLLESLPAVAVLLALRGHHVGRNAFMLSLVVAMLVFAPIAWLSVALSLQVGADHLPWWIWALLAGGLAVCAIGLVRRGWTANCAAPAALGVFLSLSAFLSVFDAPLGTFDEATRQAARGRVVWVPENFRSVAELDRFLLPGAIVRGYPAHQPSPPNGEARAGELQVVELPIDAPRPSGAIGGRIDLAGRHTLDQILDMATGTVDRHLFRRAWIVPVQVQAER